DSVCARRRKFDSHLLHFPHEEFVGYLDQYSGAVPRQGIAAARPAMRQVVEHLQPLLDDIVRFDALDIHHEADAASVVFVLGIVETLGSGDAAEGVHCHALFVSTVVFFTIAWRWRLPLPVSCCSSSVTQICVRSVCVDSTTMVSVRETPSISRIVLMSCSRDAVLLV